jgi:hypothetical protein
MDIKGIDLVASVSIVTCGVLLYLGKDGSLISLISSIVGYYFGRKSLGEGQKGASGNQTEGTQG